MVLKSSEIFFRLVGRGSTETLVVLDAPSRSVAFIGFFPRVVLWQRVKHLRLLTFRCFDDRRDEFE